MAKGAGGGGRGRAGAAGVSLLALVLFANGGDVQPLPSAAAMDVAVPVTLLWMDWRWVNLVGS